MPQATIPQQRVVEKLDDYMSRRDYAGAERHLRYWLDEARALGDERGELMVRNELVGHFRKMGDREQALGHADAALGLIDELGMGSSISAGTTYTNVATACSAFGENGRALDLFRKAAVLYGRSEHTEPKLLGGLYNNMALACVALGRFDEADSLYDKALAVMQTVENGELEQAITYLNKADMAVAQHGARAAGTREIPDAPEASHAQREAIALQDPVCASAVDDLLGCALALLDTPSVPRDGYYAFVCEKCAPVFGHYGYFLADRDLRERARAIYERA